MKPCTRSKGCVFEDGHLEVCAVGLRDMARKIAMHWMRRLVRVLAPGEEPKGG